MPWLVWTGRSQTAWTHLSSGWDQWVLSSAFATYPHLSYGPDGTSGFSPRGSDQWVFVGYRLWTPSPLVTSERRGCRRMSRAIPTGGATYIVRQSAVVAAVAVASLPPVMPLQLSMESQLSTERNLCDRKGFRLWACGRTFLMPGQMIVVADDCGANSCALATGVR